MSSHHSSPRGSFPSDSFRRRLSPLRPPRADLDPVRSSADALALISIAIQHPLEAETVGFFLDHDGFGNTITIVSDTVALDSVVDVAAVLAMAGAAVAGVSSLVLASVRPQGCTVPGDTDRWHDADAIAEANGLELLEWFVIGPGGPECPRELTGEPERWAAW